MILKITRELEKKLGIDFDYIINDSFDRAVEKYRKGSSFFVEDVFKIDAKNFPEEIYRQFDGYWKSNSYIWDDNYGFESKEINILEKVELKTKRIDKEYWENIKE
jgi:hypothetical protein